MSETEKPIIEFPCHFPIKAMGLTEHDIEQIVREISACHAAAHDILSFKCRDSAGGKYTSVTVTINAQSQEQLDNIYLALTGHGKIKVAL